MHKDKISDYDNFSEMWKKEIATIIGRRFPDRYIDDLKNEVFIIGSGRSGTSMLTKILRTHTDFCSFSEGNEIWDPKGYPWVKTNLNRPPLWYDPIKYIEVWREYFNGMYEKQLKGAFGCFQHLTKKKFFLNKSPMNTFRIPDILKMFPDAQFIHIYRDGRAVSYSWALKQFEKIKKYKKIYNNRGFYYDFDELIKYTALSWKKHIEEINLQKKEMDLVQKNILFELSYEEICADPKANLTEVCDFLSISLKDMPAEAYSNIKNMNFKWKENLPESIKNELNSLLDYN